jgi:zinc transport system substrate-binding protein
MHWEPHEHPPQSQWQMLDELLKKHPSRVMLWEDTPTAETIKSLNERNLVVAVFHPLAQRPANGDWLKAMEANVTRLEAALVSVEEPETAKPTKGE